MLCEPVTVRLPCHVCHDACCMYSPAWPSTQTSLFASTATGLLALVIPFPKLPPVSLNSQHTDVICSYHTSVIRHLLCSHSFPK